MQTRITVEEIQAAALTLAKTEQGRVMLRRLGAWAEQDTLELDLLNQRAFLALLGGAWTGNTPCVVEAVRSALVNATPDSSRAEQ